MVVGQAVLLKSLDRELGGFRRRLRLAMAAIARLRLLRQPHRRGAAGPAPLGAAGGAGGRGPAGRRRRSGDPGGGHRRRRVRPPRRRLQRDDRGPAPAGHHQGHLRALHGPGGGRGAPRPPGQARPRGRDPRAHHPLQRPGGLHLALRGAQRRRGGLPAQHLLRRGDRAHRRRRGDPRQVRRRRGDVLLRGAPAPGRPPGPGDPAPPSTTWRRWTGSGPSGSPRGSLRWTAASG